MAKEKIEGSPLKRRLTLGAAKEESVREDEQGHKNIRASEHKSMTRTTVHLSQELVTAIEVYVARNKKDVKSMSRLIERQMWKFLNENE